MRIPGIFSGYHKSYGITCVCLLLLDTTLIGRIDLITVPSNKYYVVPLVWFTFEIIPQ